MGAKEKGDYGRAGNGEYQTQKGWVGSPVPEMRLAQASWPLPTYTLGRGIESGVTAVTHERMRVLLCV